MKLPRKIIAGFDRVIDFLAYLACGLLVFALVAVSVEIIFRYFLNRPSIWVTEVTEYILLYITFLGAAWMLKKEGHVKVDLLANRLSPRNMALLSFANSIIGSAACLAITWYGSVTTWLNFQQGTFIVGLLGTPKFAVLIVIPIGSFMLFIQFLRRTHEYWKRQSSLQHDEQSRLV